MPLATRPLATAPLAGAVLDAIAQPAGALVLRQTVAEVQPAGALSLRQIVATPQAAGAIDLRQTVRFRLVQPAGALSLRQTVQLIQPAGYLQLLQRVIEPAATRVPPCYITINDVPFTHQVSISGVNISRTEDGNTTASFFAHFPVNEEIFVPAFNGKAVRILTHADSDPVLNPHTGRYEYPRPGPNNPVITLFTGTVNKASHSHDRRGIQFECSDLRKRRLAKEDPAQLRALTGAIYSPVTQQEDAEGADYVRELMRTAIGSIGYNRNGELYYYSWGTAGKPADWTLTNQDVHYRDLITDFATRDEIVNSIKIKLQYRWSLLRCMRTVVDAEKPQRLVYDSYFNSIIGRTVDRVDWRVFARDTIIEKAQGFAPWETVDYHLYPAYNQITVPGAGRDRTVWSSLMRSHCRGFKANLVRKVAQPVTEQYEITLRCPQSVDAYGEEIPGSTLSYSIDTEFERTRWEDEFRLGYSAKDEAEKSYVVSGDDGETLVEANEWWNLDGTATSEKLAAAVAQAKAEADNRRADLQLAFDAAVLIGKKELVKHHRQNIISFTLKGRVLPAELGQIVDLQTRVPSAVGQIIGLNWRFGDGIRQTDVRIAVSYMDTDVPAPVESIALPAAPVKPAADHDLTSTAAYSTEKKAFEINVAEVPEEYTNERKPDPITATFDVPLETAGITLINGR